MDPRTQVSPQCFDPQMPLNHHYGDVSTPFIVPTSALNSTGFQNQVYDRGYPIPLLFNHTYAVMQPTHVYHQSTPQYQSFGSMDGSGLSNSPYRRDNMNGTQRPPSLKNNNPVYAYPRGPPRKPRQTGHAIWVGNLPPKTDIMEFKDIFCRTARREVASVFLINKSNCAFVNMSSHAACQNAISQVNYMKFGDRRLLCKMRSKAETDPDNRAASLLSALTLSSPSTSSPMPSSNLLTPPSSPAHETVIVSSEKPPTSETASLSSTTKTPNIKRSEARFFIIKSLTVEDLQASVYEGAWEPQIQNEAILSDAFNSATNVYLVFSANKSGEYFGYARMKSATYCISDKSDNSSSRTANKRPDQPEIIASPTRFPKSIPTPATDIAPRGWIFDDSARGTVFWEARRDENDGARTSDDDDTTLPVPRTRRQFDLQWLSTARLAFQATRGMRNSWNGNREVKIARDGVELEPSVGRELIRMFGRGPEMVPQISGFAAQRFS